MRIGWTIWMVAIAIMGVVCSSDALTEHQQEVLELVEDYTAEVDGPGLYELLDAVRGEQEPKEIDLALDEVIAKPVELRGKRVAVEGQLARVRPVKLTRDVAGKVDEWAVVQSNGQVVMIYVIYPPVEAMGVEKAQVRVAGWFYKIWRDRDQMQKERDYVVLVAGQGGIEWLKRDRAFGTERGIGIAPEAGLILLAAVVVLWLIFRRIRAMGNNRQPVDWGIKSKVKVEDSVQNDSGKSPAQALAAMDQRIKEPQNSEQHNK